MSQSKSLYAIYYEERSGGQVVEFEDLGFVAYRVLPDSKEVFLDEIFIIPGHRAKGSGSALLNEVCSRVKPGGTKYMTCSISPAAKGSSEALAAALRYGFKLHSTGAHEVFLMKEI